jgi:hypothetical protein
LQKAKASAKARQRQSKGKGNDRGKKQNAGVSSPFDSAQGQNGEAKVKRRATRKARATAAAKAKTTAKAKATTIDLVASPFGLRSCLRQSGGAASLLAGRGAEAPLYLKGKGKGKSKGKKQKQRQGQGQGQGQRQNAGVLRFAQNDKEKKNVRVRMTSRRKGVGNEEYSFSRR